MLTSCPTLIVCDCPSNIARTIIDTFIDADCLKSKLGYKMEQISTVSKQTKENKE